MAAVFGIVVVSVVAVVSVVVPDELVVVDVETVSVVVVTVGVWATRMSACAVISSAVAANRLRVKSQFTRSSPIRSRPATLPPPFFFLYPMNGGSQCA